MLNEDGSQVKIKFSGVRAEFIIWKDLIESKLCAEGCFDPVEGLIPVEPPLPEAQTQANMKEHREELRIYSKDLKEYMVKRQKAYGIIRTYLDARLLSETANEQRCPKLTWDYLNTHYGNARFLERDAMTLRTKLQNTKMPEDFLQQIV
jgi:hypothetical protein